MRRMLAREGTPTRLPPGLRSGDRTRERAPSPRRGGSPDGRNRPRRERRREGSAAGSVSRFPATRGRTLRVTRRVSQLARSQVPA